MGWHLPRPAQGRQTGLRRQGRPRVQQGLRRRPAEAVARSRPEPARGSVALADQLALHDHGLLPGELFQRALWMAAAVEQVVDEDLPARTGMDADQRSAVVDPVELAPVEAGAANRERGGGLRGDVYLLLPQVHVGGRLVVPVRPL